MPKKKSPPDACSKLKRLLKEAREENEYYKSLAAEAEKKRLREMDLMSSLITARKRAEEALRESEQTFRTFFDLSPQAIALMETATGKLIDVNKKFSELTHYDRKEILGRTTTEAGFCSEEDRRRCLKELEASGETQGFEMDFRVKDGSVRNARMFSKAIGINGENFVLSIFEDVTIRKRLESQLRQVQKMRAIGTLASGIAHDFNNLLMGIQGNVSLMRYDMDSKHPHWAMLDSIEKQVRSGAKLSAQFLGYAREGKYEVGPVNLNRLVEETSETFGRTKKELNVRLFLAKDLRHITADEGQIEQILLNLYLNAADAMASGGTLTIETMNVSHEHMKGNIYDPKPGHYALLRVTDTGMGMDEETMQRIFEPFFTTKEMGRGTGLGLASVYGIVKGHGGYIDVESEKGRGATFSVYLKSASPDRELLQDIGSSSPVTTGNETILLVDDENAVLDMIAKLLRKLGYSVLEAAGGKEAVGIYGQERDHIDLVILDMVMPDMGGKEVYERIKEINPGVLVLLSTGYSMEGRATEMLEKGCNGFIQKPFRIEDLSKKIRNLLKRS